MDIRKITNTVIIFTINRLIEIGAIIICSLGIFLFLLLNISTLIAWLAKVFAKDKLISPSPIIHTFIIILILTIKIR